MSDAGEPAVLLDGVSKTFGEGAVAVHALAEVDLAVPHGELAVILGPSGSGKTTMLNLIGGIDAPTAGRVVVAGTDLSSLDTAEQTAFRRASVAFVFQFFNLIPTLTARENVELVTELTGDGAHERASRTLAQVGLEGREDHFPTQLSGGEQQRVAIARALAKDAPLLLCDEPTGELDFETGRHILGLLRRLNQEGGRTILIVTHNSPVARMADRVVRLRSGRVTDDHRNEAPVDAGELIW